MNLDQFVAKFEGDHRMTRMCSVVVVETTDGHLLARAESPYEIAYCASRVTSKAIGRASSAAVFGDFADAEAFETPEAALEYARTTPVDYH